MDLKRIVYVVLGVAVALVLISTLFVMTAREESAGGDQLGARTRPPLHVARAYGV
jgi:uncharacterized membrane protein YuzA (DUF378 family)